MKRRIVLLVLATLMLTFTFCSCGEDRAANPNSNHLTGGKISGFENIPGEELLFFNTKTKVIYFFYSSYELGGYGYGYMSPYISENGNYCRYIDDKIVEIQK